MAGYGGGLETRCVNGESACKLLCPHIFWLAVCPCVCPVAECLCVCMEAVRLCVRACL